MHTHILRRTNVHAHTNKHKSREYRLEPHALNAESYYDQNRTAETMFKAETEQKKGERYETKTEAK